MNAVSNAVQTAKSNYDGKLVFNYVVGGVALALTGLAIAWVGKKAGIGVVRDVGRAAAG